MIACTASRTAWGSFSHETSKMCMEANPKTGLLFSFRRVLTVLVMFYVGLLPFVDVPETHFEIPGMIGIRNIKFS